MFIDLVELLRCAREHEESWLVAAIHRAAGRVILDGRLGCPVCGAQYPITDGVADMRQGVPHRDQRPAWAADPWRVAALLDLQPPATVAVLHGELARASEPLLEIFSGAVIAVNPPEPLLPRERLAIILAASLLPLRSESANGVAVSAADQPLLSDAARVLRPGGRLLAPIGGAIPRGLREVARDAREWVAVREPAATAVQLTRG